MNKSQAILVVVSVAVVAALIGASLYMSGAKEDDNLQVVASFYPLAYMAEEIGGDRVTVKSLIPANTEVHAWQPSPGDIMAADDADVLLYNGAGLDHWFEEKILSVLSQKNRTVNETTHGIDLLGPGQGEDHILEEIHHTIHEWGDGTITAEAALGEVDELIHDLEYKSPLLEEIDHIIHEWEDGDMTALEAMGVIEELIHDYGHLLEEIDNIIHEWEEGVLTADVALEEIDGLVHDFPHKSHTLEQIDTIIHEWEGGGMTAEEAMEAIEELLHDLEHGHGTRSTRQDDHDHGDVDPHTWVSPFIARQQAENVYKALVKADSDGESYYTPRWEEFSARLSDLDSRYKTELASKTNGTIVVAHAAYGYLAQRYGFEMHGAIGMSADQLPSALTIKNLVDLMENEGIRTLYVNPIYKEDYIQTLKTNIKTSTGDDVYILKLYLMLGPTDGLDYMAQMEQNLENLKLGLTG